jgi:hypothetical protein
MAHERLDLLSHEPVWFTANRLKGGCGQDRLPHSVLTKKSIFLKIPLLARSQDVTPLNSARKPLPIRL